MNSKESLALLLTEKERPACDMCKCGECGWQGKTTECETETGQDGWEMPGYLVHLCPVCQDGGCVDDFWYSYEIFQIMGEK